ncbi:MerR family transcriptional regulator [Tahibacter caeni]|uniref:MerR family transcriptional regulator n=1 Tax=Tahibacter caeni TaxID=1453545 RepID=UPI0021478690|nr:MerR family transcriptional regulator [Tahibacter caeni]
MATTPTRYLRIGDLARRSGVSAKALRLYEQRGLLRPAAHSAAGYRLYDAGSLAALSRIVVLKRAGFRLAEIGQLLARDATAATRLLAARIATLERECAERAQALQALRSLAQRVVVPSTLDLDDLVETIAMSTQLQVDWTAREREDFRRRAEQLGPTGLAEAQALWPELIAQVRAALNAGTPAQAPEAQDLARRWYALVQVFTGGDAAVARKLGDAWQAQPDAMAAQGLDPALFAYVGEAMRAAELSL